MRLVQSCVIAIFLVIVVAAHSQESHNCQFEIYLLRNADTQLYEVARTPIDQLLLAEVPWITAQDISSYKWDSHKIFLLEDSAHLVNRVPSIAYGPDTPVVVVANGERIYMGYFPCLASSFIGPFVSVVRLCDNGKGLWLGWSEREWEGESDPRSDVRIRESLETCGILVE